MAVFRVDADGPELLSDDGYVIQWRGDSFFVGIPFANKAKLRLETQVYASRWDYRDLQGWVDIKEVQQDEADGGGAPA